jgi:hypothetical protein
MQLLVVNSGGPPSFSPVQNPAWDFITIEAIIRSIKQSVLTGALSTPRGPMPTMSCGGIGSERATK